MFEQPRHRSESILSHRTNTTWRSDVYGRPRLERGGMVFTGPDSLRMHRQTVLDPKYVGEGNWGWTPERTSSAYYITRAAPGAPHPRPKSSYSDAYGFGCWGPTAEMCSWKERGHGIELGPFRQQVEQNVTHFGQAPWYPDPNQNQNNTSASYQSRSHSGSQRGGTANRPTTGGRILNQRQQKQNNSNITSTSRTGSQQSLSTAT